MHPRSEVIRKDEYATTLVEARREFLALVEAVPSPTGTRRLFFDRFAPPNGKLVGRILLSKDFDGTLGTGDRHLARSFDRETIASQ